MSKIAGIACLLCFSRRRTVGLKITERGEVVVYAPHGLSPRDLAQVVRKYQGWIATRQTAVRQAWSQLQPGKVYYRGEPFSLERDQGREAGVLLEAGRFRVLGLSPQEDPWPLLCSWYREQAIAVIGRQVAHFASVMKLPPPKWEIGSWRRRWGDCPGPGRVRFNWRLILLPPEILDYVVIHELAHLKVRGHPPRFWKLVGRHLPDYATRRKWLKSYGEPFLHWRWTPEEREEVLQTLKE